MLGDYLLDTNALIALLKRGMPTASASKRGCYCSVITEIELLSYRNLNDEELQALRSLFCRNVVIGLTEAVKEQAIALRRKTNLKVPDAIIAATAQCEGLTLVTDDAQILQIQELGAIPLREIVESEGF